MHTNINAENVITTPDVNWIYSKPANTSATCFLLTEGGVAMKGKWGDGSGLRAWFPMPKRNKLLESQLKTENF